MNRVFKLGDIVAEKIEDYTGFLWAGGDQKSHLFDAVIEGRRDRIGGLQ
jgi:hypothetical protein